MRPEVVCALGMGILLLGHELPTIRALAAPNPTTVPTATPETSYARMLVEGRLSREGRLQPSRLILTAKPTLEPLYSPMIESIQDYWERKGIKDIAGIKPMTTRLEIVEDVEVYDLPDINKGKKKGFSILPGRSILVRLPEGIPLYTVYIRDGDEITQIWAATVLGEKEVTLIGDPISDIPRRLEGSWAIPLTLRVDGQSKVLAREGKTIP